MNKLSIQKNKFIIGCSILLCLVIVIAIGLFIYFSISIPEKNATYKEYSWSEYADWIVIPESSSSIDTFSFLGFDTNYRFVKANLKDSNFDLKLLADKSLAKQSIEINRNKYAEVTDFKITLLEFNKVFFGGIKDSTPAWWDKELNRFDRCFVCFWDDGGAPRYGFGYMYLLDTREKELRVFQWNSQWGDVKIYKKLFNSN